MKDDFFERQRQSCNTELRKLMKLALNHESLHRDPDQWLIHWSQRIFETPAFFNQPRDLTTMQKALSRICAKYVEVVKRKS